MLRQPPFGSGCNTRLVGEGIDSLRADRFGACSGCLALDCCSRKYLTLKNFQCTQAKLYRLLIAITDTWLHLVTHTISIPQVSLLDTASINGSFRVSENCTNMKTTFEGGCTLNSAAANTFLMGSQEAFPLLVNSSNTAMVKTYVESGENGAEYAYLGLPSLPSLANADYTGTTFAAKTSCKPTTQECFSEDRISGPGAFYKCPFAMEGFIETGVIDTIQWAYFTDQTGDDNQTVLVSVQNPYYFAAIFSVNQNVGWKPFIQDDPQMKTGLHGATLFASFCETTVYDVEYSQVNGTIVRWNQKQSNNSMANIFEGTQQYTEVGSPFIIQASAVAAQNSNSSDEVAQKFALAYSQAALALAAAALIPESAIEAQRRDNILVARVPKTPLFLLIATNLLLVVLGVILTVLALLALGTSDIGEVQARLCIPALSAAHFERMQGEQSVKRVEDLFEERQGAEGVRIGIERGYNGGWKFVSRGAIE